MATIARMVEAGLGISIVPALSLWQFRRAGLSSRPLELPHLARPIHLLKRRGYGLSHAAMALFDHLIHQKKSLAVLARKGTPDSTAMRKAILD